MIIGSVVVMVDTTLDPTEASVLPTVLVGDVAEDAEFEVMLGFARVEIKEVFSEGVWSGPRSRHSLKGR
jgi:hypothetical protein